MSFELGEQHAARVLREVGLPDPFDVAEFCRRVAALRGRPLRLVAEPSGAMGEAVGLLVGLRDRDEIHYLSDTSRYHQQAIVLHEVGHLMCEHAGTGGEPFPLALLAGDWDPAVVERLRGRHRYHDDEEYEAEGFATAVLDRVDRQLRRGGLRAAKDPSPRPAGERLSSMFLR